MGDKTRQQKTSYAYYIDNIKLLLIFLVVFNHMIAFQLKDVNTAANYIYYGIFVFHMPAFIFISGFLSRKKQDALKNTARMMIPYVLGYTITWLSYLVIGDPVEYQLLRPSQSAMWYLLALLAYRLVIDALGQVRFIVPVSILVGLWAGTEGNFSTFLSMSRIVVFFPFFVAGYLWKPEYTKKLRAFRGKWILAASALLLLFLLPNYLIQEGISVAILRGNASYEACSLPLELGVGIRLLTYLISFILIFAMLAVSPDKKLPITYAGKNTMGTYILHYPILILMNGFGILSRPEFLNLGVTAAVSLVMVFVLGSYPVAWIYERVTEGLDRLVFKTTEDGAQEIETKGAEPKADSAQKSAAPKAGRPSFAGQKRSLEEIPGKDEGEL